MAEAPPGTVVTKLLELAQLDSSYLSELEKFRRAIVVMFTDIQGSTAYFEKYGDAAGLLMIHQCNEDMRRVVESRGGRVVKTIGDGMMVAFNECALAVEAAVEMQISLVRLNANRPETDHVAVRIGLHYDTGIVRTNDIFGDVVNVASRVESVAAPGQIVVSDTLYEKVNQSGLDIHELGRFVLKGKSHQRTLYEVRWQVFTASPSIPAKAEPADIQAYRLQRVGKDGAVTAEYPIVQSLTIGRTQGDVKFPTDINLAPLNARVFLEQGQLFVEDLSGGSESVFVQLAAGHTMLHDDVILMGRQVFHYRELPGVMEAATQVGATLSDVTGALREPVAELLRLDEQGRGTSFPFRHAEVQFGRTRGTYTFPEDRMMSRQHARVLQRGEDFVLEDLGSRNGTFVKVIRKTPIPAGAAVLVGSELLRVTS